jgi:hypothetical protein
MHIVCLYGCTYLWIWFGAIDNVDEGDDDEYVHVLSCVLN